MRTILTAKWGFTSLVLGLVLPVAETARADFQAGHIFVAGSRNAAVFEFDADFNPVSSWTHPSFGSPPQFFLEGPAGMDLSACRMRIRPRARWKGGSP